MHELKIGVPTNETLLPVVLSLLERSGFSVKREPKHFFARAENIEFVFARMSEIARLIRMGLVGCGFITKDWWAEHTMYRGATAPFDHLAGMPRSPAVLREFPSVCRCDLAFITNDYWHAEGVEGNIPSLIVGFMGAAKRNVVITTRFPRLSSYYLAVQKGITEDYLHEKLGRHNRYAYNIHFLIVNGSEELYVLIGAADFGIAQVESGETIRNHDLRIVEKILESHLLLVGSNSPAVRKFAARLH